MLTYKKMEVSDISQMTRLYIETFNAPPWNDNWTEETASRRLHQMIHAEDFYGLCAYREGELCGLILGVMEQFYDGMHFLLREFCVSNRRRGGGLGTEIYRQFEAELARLGVGEITLSTLRGRQTEHFYQKLGFQNDETLVFMKKTIGRGDTK